MYCVKRIVVLMMLFVGAMVLTASSPVSMKAKKNKPIRLRTEKPQYLKRGDRVALLSPAYYVEYERVVRAAEVMRGWGLEPVIAPNVGKVHLGKYAGTIEERLSDIRWALNDTSIKAIVCNRGGYGTMQYIDSITHKEWRRHPKWLVGFSDITTLHGLLVRAGVMSIHGTMNTFLANGGEDVSSTVMRDLLMGKVPQYEIPPHSQNIEGHATGILVGGNLCTLAPNCGSQADATLGRDIILFLEEVGEPMRNIDRQFQILLNNGVLDRCKGVILGDFSDSNTEFSYESIEAMLREYIEKYHIPLLCGFPGGHGDLNLPLVMGANVTMDVRGDGASLTFDIDGERQVVRTVDIAGGGSLAQ